jgi:Tol biopolymer transport system component
VPDQSDRISQLYAEALSRHANDRAEFLRQVCQGDESLRLELESLIAHANAPDSILDAPPLDAWAAHAVAGGGESFIGRTISGYRILSTLGAGGMGEVYRAHDTTLGRDVALKILPASFTNDPERQARFKREAQLLAAVNHPNIGAIYGLAEADPFTALVLELVEGETLADRIARAAVPIKEALSIATQLVDALEAAHEQGIIHRDLKPANIKMRPDGLVKVLDFGLAKAFDPATASGAGARMSPKLSIHATRAGLILGTAAYMAPEQASGKAVDKRADIWAFGCVLYEMLTGRRPFDGDDISATLAAVLATDPDWRALPSRTPMSLRPLLRRCLEKDPRQRLRDIGEARVQLNDLRSGHAEGAGLTETMPGRAKARDRLPWLIAAGALLAFIGTVAVATWLWWGRRRPVPAKVAFDIVTDASASPNQLALSPDGTRLAAVITTATSTALWLRQLDEVDGRILVAKATDGFYPFWSADSRFLAFFADGKLNKIDVSRGSSQPVCDAPVGRGGTWNRDGVILFAPSSVGPLFRVTAGGGTTSQVTELDRARGDAAHQHPKFLPDGQHFLFLVRSTKVENGGLYLGSLGSTETRRLVATDVMGLFAAPNHVLFVRDATLMAQQFDTRRFALQGDPFPVAQDVGLSSTGTGVAAIATSDTGVLAYRIGISANDRLLRWVDRTGKPFGDVGTAGAHGNAVIAPRGDRLAETRLQGQDGSVWIVDLQRGSSSRLTFGPGLDDNAIWSPDGQQIVFASTRNGGVRNIYRKNANGTGEEELLLKTDNTKFPTDWSGGYVLYTEVTSSPHVWALPLSGDRKPIRLVNSPSTESHARLSPDGRWIAYTSLSETDRVYVQPFPRGSGKWQVSTTTGFLPRWRGDGRELFYLNTGAVWAVDVTTTTFTSGVPRKLFDAIVATGPMVTGYDVTADGQRFLLNVDTTSANRAIVTRPIRVVLNWQSALPARETR